MDNPKITNVLGKMDKQYYINKLLKKLFGFSLKQPMKGENSN